jgi:hypothetical protein
MRLSSRSWLPRPRGVGGWSRARVCSKARSSEGPTGGSLEPTTSRCFFQLCPGSGSRMA